MNGASLIIHDDEDKDRWVALPPRAIRFDDDRVTLVVPDDVRALMERPTFAGAKYRTRFGGGSRFALTIPPGSFAEVDGELVGQVVGNYGYFAEIHG